MRCLNLTVCNCWLLTIVMSIHFQFCSSSIVVICLRKCRFIMSYWLFFLYVGLTVNIWYTYYYHTNSFLLSKYGGTATLTKLNGRCLKKSFFQMHQYLFSTTCYSSCFYSMFFSVLPSYLALEIASEWSSVMNIVRLDTAVTSMWFRSAFLNMLVEFPVFGHSEEFLSVRCLEWMSQRTIAPKHLSLKTSLKPTLTSSEWKSLHKWNLTALSSITMDHCSNHHFVILQAAIHDSRCLREIRVMNIFQAISDEVLNCIAYSPHTESLQVLELKFNLVVLTGASSFFQSLHKYQYLSELRLVGCSRFTAGIIEKIVSHLWRTLRILVLHYNVQDYACAIRLIASRCLLLEHLSLCCFFIDYENISHLSTNCPHLTSLSLTQCYQIRTANEVITYLALPNHEAFVPTTIAAFPALTHLNVKHNGSWLLQPMIVTLLKACPKLLSLNMQSSMYQTNNSAIMRYVADHLSHITQLDVSVCPNLNDDVVYLVSHCTQLQDLNLQACDISDSALYAIASHCYHLHTLNLLTNYRITTAAVMHIIDSCIHLKYLHIVRGMHITLVNELNIDMVKRYADKRNNEELSTTQLAVL